MTIEDDGIDICPDEQDIILNHLLPKLEKEAYIYCSENLDKIIKSLDD